MRKRAEMQPSDDEVSGEISGEEASDNDSWDDEDLDENDAETEEQPNKEQVRSTSVTYSKRSVIFLLSTVYSCMNLLCSF